MANPLAVETFNDLISLALRNAGVVGVGQSANAQDITDCAKLLNSMIGIWQRNRYLIYHLVEQGVACNGSQSYSVGPGGDFSVSPRPADIKYAFALQQNTTSLPIRYPVRLLPSREDYALIQLPTLNSFPQWAWYDAAMPFGQLYVYPVISNQFSLFIGYPEILQSVTSLTDKIIMPPEYIEALLYNLAMVIAGAYQLTPSAVVAGRAIAALETLRTVNAQVPMMTMPRMLRGASKYNVFSDQAY